MNNFDLFTCYSHSYSHVVELQNPTIMGFKKVIHAFHRVLLLLLIHIKKETKIGKMKIIAQKQLIETVLIQMQPFLEKKDITQIISHLYIKTMDNTVILETTNTETGLIVKIENVVIEKKSKISLNSINLIKFLKTISPTIDMNNPKFKSNINNRYILHINCYNANCHLI